MIVWPREQLKWWVASSICIIISMVKCLFVYLNNNNGRWYFRLRILDLKTYPFHSIKWCPREQSFKSKNNNSKWKRTKINLSIVRFVEKASNKRAVWLNTLLQLMRERNHLNVNYVIISMTSLLMHNVAHSTRHSFRPKTNNQPLKKFLSLAFSWVKVVKNWTSF